MCFIFLQLITPLTTFQTLLYLPKTFMPQEKKCSENKLFMNLFFKTHLSVFDDHHLSFFFTPFSSLLHSLSLSFPSILHDSSSTNLLQSYYTNSYSSKFPKITGLGRLFLQTISPLLREYFSS